ncbi:hypothetical protein [Corynebacterium halotolerans]|uniref:hypothetical protein n=1 Tax=Corynebacterium halotolerans TaxID=225326 RepID=UPI003CF18A9B
MLIPLPGHTHLKVLRPVKPENARETKSEVLPIDRRTATGLTVLALETAFGMRPARTLAKQRFEPAVRSYLAAYLRRRPDRGPVRLDSLHLRADAAGVEVFGSCTVAGAPRGFTARLVNPERLRWRMRLLRILS